jgi:exonuclease III
VRILAWNLLHGGGRRLELLAAAIVAHEPDVCVLAEARATAAPALLDRLAHAGLVHHATSHMPPRQNGVLIASAVPITPLEPPDGEMYRQRWVRVGLPGAAFELVACHVPPKISIGEDRKRAFWTTLLGYAGEALERPAMIVGDLNTGAPYRDEHRATLYSADQFVALNELGWIDAWRRFHGADRKEWSWVYPRRRTYGYRLDHAFCSPPLAPRLTACRYSHDERERGVSDHSILLVDVAGDVRRARRAGRTTSR